MKGSSAELQEISLVTFINDSYMLAKCRDQMDEGFYESIAYKLIFRALCTYYDKYLAIPNSSDIKLIIKELHNEEYGDVEDICMTVDKLYSQKISSEEFSNEKTLEFIKRCKTERGISKIVQSMKGTGEIDLEKAYETLMEVGSLSIARKEPFNLGDIDRIPEIRKEALGDTEHPLIAKFFIDAVNRSFQYGGMIVGTLNMIVAPPGRGKTTMLINQGICSAMQGLKVCHVFLGDMKPFDGLLRYLSCLTQRQDSSNNWIGLTSKELSGLSDEELMNVARKYKMAGWFNNIDIYEYAADELSANQFIEEVKIHQRTKNVHYDVIIIDYDENLRDEEESMYKSGGQVYNKLANFAVVNRSILFIAAQPKKEFWEKDIIPLEAASESSKKQKIIDLMITIGRPKSSNVGTIFIAKNRRGTDGNAYRIRIDGASGKMNHITEQEFNMIRQQERQGSSNQPESSGGIDPNMFKN